VEANFKFLETPVQYAKGVGPYLAERFEKLSVRTMEDLLYHLPFRYLDRRSLSSLRELPVGANGVVLAEVHAAGETVMGRSRKKIYEVLLGDGTGYLSAKWFHYRRDYMEGRFKKGAKFIFSGEVSAFRGQKQMVHPEAQSIHEFFDEDELKKHLGLVPIYSTTDGLTQKKIRGLIHEILETQGKSVDETLPGDLLRELEMPGLLESFREIHAPSEQQMPERLNAGTTPYHGRLVFEEFLFLQLGLGLRRRQTEVCQGFRHEPRVGLKNRLLQALPFQLTQSQGKAIDEICYRMCSETPMNVLLQGDVGSGKTLVGMVAALLALENQKQVALMVPTEILAEQHFTNFQRMLQPLGVSVELLTSSTKSQERKKILSGLLEEKPLLVIGTHALIEGDVEFPNLSLAIIDEQHRFGVRQRMQLMNKSRRPDVLVMTATPIPRSLAMTLYGDLDLVLMTEMPRGRRPVQTRIMYEKNRPKLYEFIRQKVGEGRQAYFVFPLIEESEKLDLKDATQAYVRLQREFPEFKVGMIHGRMKAQEKEAVMRGFSGGEIQILVATTVIEVGIDVPNASVMVIEHAERFGLSQLHQLRGRVGRGLEKSYCILATDFRQSEIAKFRLKVMEENFDGFKIAEEDLSIRGPGDFLGTRQSGIPELRVANLIRDLPLLEKAKEVSARILKADPALSDPAHSTMKYILKKRWQDRLGLGEVG
jgi:ATP-dependent DNA helicase RecG